ncbi:hypothetical protein AGMMS50230_21580 [Spirochaetia bacterium]|nr:hypothetical protein AGMMS50230_21580 [Spirochaetia bacterium]
MKRKIPCLCENTFTVEIPEEIDLDAENRYLAEIVSGAFMNFTCTSCGKKHKPEFPITVLWPSRDLRLEVLPELERMSFYHEKKEKDRNMKTGTVIGYPELADRLRVIRDGLEPAAVEALKYYLLLKAEETCPDEEISIWYHRTIGPLTRGPLTEDPSTRGPSTEGPLTKAPSKDAGALEFHLQGLKENSVAVTKVPLEVYEKTLADYKKHPKSELFAALRFRTYLSVQNMMTPKGASLDMPENSK